MSVDDSEGGIRELLFPPTANGSRKTPTKAKPNERGSLLGGNKASERKPIRVEQGYASYGSLDKLLEGRKKPNQVGSNVLASPSADGTAIVHTVSMRDTLASLSLKYGVKAEEIKRANKLYTNNDLFARKTIFIPTNEAALQIHEQNKQDETNRVHEEKAEVENLFSKTTGADRSIAQFYLEKFRYCLEPAINKYEIDFVTQQALPSKRKAQSSLMDDDFYMIDEPPIEGSSRLGHHELMLGDDPHLAHLGRKQQEKLERDYDRIFDL